MDKRRIDGRFPKGVSGNPKGRPVGSKARPSQNVTIINEFIGAFKLGRYYVYYHIDKTNGRIFYIGKGRGDRAYIVGSGRSDRWHRYVSGISGNYEVRLVAINLSEPEALIIEGALIRMRNPICNEHPGAHVMTTGDLFTGG